MKTFISPLTELAEFETVRRKCKNEKGIFQFAGCVNSQKTHMMYAISDGFKFKIIATSSEMKAKQIYEEYRFLDNHVYFYPAKDLLFYQADLRGKLLVKQRMEVFQAMMEQEQLTIVTSFDSFMDALLPLETVKKRVQVLKLGQTVDFEQLKRDMVAIGYDREEQIDGPGQFAVRGGILDIYPLTEEVPIRIELWGDEIDSIRTFDVESQRSIENLKEIIIYPATDFPEENAKRVSLLDYFNLDDTILFLDEPVRLIEKGEGVAAEFIQAQANRMESGYDVSAEEMKLFSVKELAEKMSHFHCAAFSALDMKCKELRAKEVFHLQSKSVNPYNNSFEMLTRDLKRLKRSNYRVVLLSGSRTRAKRLAEDLRDYNLSSFYSEDIDREVGEGEIMVSYGHVTEGYEYPMLKFMVISETDIFGKVKKKKKRKIYEGQRIQSFTELKTGDYVVHENHGLGIYQGIEKIEVDKVAKDYMKISYAGGGNLYIPATQLDLIQKYASSDARKPKLNRLGCENSKYSR